MAAATLQEFGSRIRVRRTELGLTQAALAATVGISRNSLIGLESGRGHMSLDTVLRVLDALDLAVTFEDRPMGEVALGQPMDRIDLDALVERHRGR